MRTAPLASADQAPTGGTSPAATNASRSARAIRTYLPILWNRQVVEVRGRGPVVTEPKMSSRRLVHLPEPAIDALRRRFDAVGPMLPTARVFRRPDGSELRLMHLKWYRRMARKRAGIDQAHFHDLRHAGLTLSAQVGATLAITPGLFDATALNSWRRQGQCTVW